MGPFCRGKGPKLIVNFTIHLLGSAVEMSRILLLILDMWAQILFKKENKAIPFKPVFDLI